MREIKFRAWDKENERMYPDIGINPIKEYSENEGSLLTLSSDGIFIRYDNDRFHLLQYTGLKDKNGKEIYEGDIILCDSLLRKCPHEIIWTEISTGTICGTFGWYLTGVSNPGYGFTGGEEIIGNIYQDSHLLETSN